MSEETDAFFLKINWSTDSDPETPVQYHACMGLSKSKESFEIQIFAEDKLTFAFRTNPQSASIVPPSGENIISFQSSGALPVPQFDVVRDIGDGSWNGLRETLALSTAPMDRTPQGKKGKAVNDTTTSKGPTLTPPTPTESSGGTPDADLADLSAIALRLGLACALSSLSSVRELSV